MTAPAPKLQAVPAKAPGPSARKLKKGELLFSEAETSRAMYYLKSGIIRIFKKKGDSDIEIDTLHSGQILGELAFLDGNPRSASAEALTECELVEVSGPTFTQVLQTMPEWLKILMKTLVGRLRTASTRIRQLETASSAYDYSEKDGKRSAHYVYLSTPDILKLCTAILLVGVRNGKALDGGGYELRIGLLNRYANQILGVPLAKLTTMLDILSQVGIVKTIDDADNTLFVLADPDFLEGFIAYQNEENLLEPSKRHDLSIKGFMIMSLMVKHSSNLPKDAEGFVQVNVASIRKLEAETQGKEPFRLDDFNEVAKHGYTTSLQILSASEALASFKHDDFLRSYRMQRVMMTLHSINEQKRRNGGPR